MQTPYKFQSNYTAKITLSSRVGNSVWTFDLDGVTATEVVEAFRRIKIAAAELGCDAFLPNEVRVLAESEAKRD